MSNPDWLERAALRAQRASWTLAYTFERYRQLEERTEAELARDLCCTREVLYWLCLCRKPEGPDFDTQVTAITERHEVNRKALVDVIRHVEIVEALSKQVTAANGEEPPLQMAARDRVPGEKTSP
ncbi:hypothetical protein [Myxococcus qinghaiensis]|uniref:hypothetical protein n=1 Tax=Myxococcus qinghaiensis TaxID=2906758 RepID=UPI0020A7C99C|nr:hypothetical protein [Myxococcus qinghaiensis]MCP3169582.1 hypothetical protein [Myxococcus qinghaiensis]